MFSYIYWHTIESNWKLNANKYSKSKVAWLSSNPDMLLLDDYELKHYMVLDFEYKLYFVFNISFPK